MGQKKYTVNELLHNTSFRNMAKGTADADELQYWSQWIESSEKNRLKARKALRKISGFSFAPANKPDIEQEWERLQKKIMGNFDRRLARPNRGSTVRWIARIAASILLIAVASFSVYIYDDSVEPQTHLDQITQEETVVTRSGQQKTLTFKNDSKTAKIILNSNSSIKYKLGLIRDKPIEVTLEGEAFFDVEEGFSPNHSVFSVRTPNGIIEDVGTKFLVTVGNGLSRVVLQEGLVHIKTKPSKVTDNSKMFEVAENQMIEFNSDNVIRKESVNSTFYTSWATGLMKFDRTSIRTFAQFVEQRFEVEVKVLVDLDEIMLDGAVYYNSLESLVRSVSEITKIPVYQSAGRDTVYIGNSRYANSNPR